MVECLKITQPYVFSLHPKAVVTALHITNKYTDVFKAPGTSALGNEGKFIVPFNL